MRTTITFEPDVAAALARLRPGAAGGISEIVNDLIRAGLRKREQRPPAQAWGHVRRWLDSDLVWTPGPTPHHAEVFGRLVVDHDLRGNIGRQRGAAEQAERSSGRKAENLVSDAHLAALAIEHGLRVFSADSDFARFPELTWVNPLHNADQPAA